MPDILERLSKWESSIDSVCDAGVPLNGPALKELLADARAEIIKVRISASRANAKAAQLNKLINTPELEDFAKGVIIEAVHQMERWPSDHDAGKTPADWFWLIGYLAQKAMYSAIAGDRDKMLHHAITTAAALANWHLQMLGQCNMRPGIDRKEPT